jgi:hypothetical protein
MIPQCPRLLKKLKMPRMQNIITTRNKNSNHRPKIQSRLPRSTSHYHHKLVGVGHCPPREKAKSNCQKLKPSFDSLLIFAIP